MAIRHSLEKQQFALDSLADRVPGLLEEAQAGLLERAREHRASHTTRVDDFDEFQAKLDDPGGFLAAHWDGTEETEETIKNRTKATKRPMVTPIVTSCSCGTRIAPISTGKLRADHRPIALGRLP